MFYFKKNYIPVLFCTLNVKFDLETVDKFLIQIQWILHQGDQSSIIP